MTLTPRPHQGHCQQPSPHSHSHTHTSISWKKLRDGGRKTEQRRGHYLDETVLCTAARANLNTVLVSFNGDYTAKVQPELILFNTAYNSITGSVCVCCMFATVCLYLIYCNPTAHQLLLLLTPWPQSQQPIKTPTPAGQ